MDTIMTLASIPAILAVVELAKRFGLKGPWPALVAVIVGVVFAYTDFAFAAFPVYGAISGGLLTGLAAAGLYDVAKLATQNKSTTSDDPNATDELPGDDSAELVTAPGGRSLSAAALKMLGK